MISLISRIRIQAGLGGMLCLLSLSSSGSDSEQPYHKLIESIKSQIIEIGLSEKTYLHSVGRAMGSIIESEESFFVTTVDLDNLEIRVENESSARVQIKTESPSSLHGDSHIAQCKGEVKRGSRLPAVALRQSSTLPRSTSVAVLNGVELFQASVLEQFTSSSLIRSKRAIPNMSQYQKLLSGGSWGEFRNEVSIHFHYDAQLQARRSGQMSSWKTSKVNSSSEPFLELTFSVDDHEMKSTRIDVPEAEMKSLGASALSSSNPEVSPWLIKINDQIGQFIEDLSCFVDYPSLVQVQKGKLYLEAGLDAGYFQGDKLILVPNRAYFSKRGLLAAADRIAVASISSIENHRASLEIVSGYFELEDGAEFNAKPILEVL